MTADVAALDGERADQRAAVIAVTRRQAARAQRQKLARLPFRRAA